MPLHSPGILMVGHGTRQVAGQRQFLDLAKATATYLPGIPLEACFLELAEPTIEQALHQLATRCQSAIILPLLLFSAGHAKQDIPDEVQNIAHQLKFPILGQVPALEHHPAVIQLSANRFQEAVASAATPPTPADTFLLMLGRGSSDREAVRAMRFFTYYRRLLRQANSATTGFFAVAKPSVKQAFEFAHQKRSQTSIVVQPHLLFDGQLWREAEALTLEYQTLNPSRNWYIAQPLGADDALAKVLAQMAIELIQKQ
ncbi:MAG: Sirohydrochlorin cobaltochelatase [Planctomycetota bacterium]|jgi:sirohydrochlorin cobaltochelatase